MNASACRLQVSLSCAVLCQIVSLQYLSRSSLYHLAGLPCHLFLSYGLHVVTREVHRSSLKRSVCSAQDHFICLTLLIMSMTFVLSRTYMLVLLSLYVMLSMLLLFRQALGECRTMERKIVSLSEPLEILRKQSQLEFNKVKPHDANENNSHQFK